MLEDKVAQQIAQFVINHEQHIVDNVADFGLLLSFLKIIKEYTDEEETNTENNPPKAKSSQA